MPAIQWRPEVNVLTIPQSYSIRFVARRSAGLNDLAADIALRHPNFSRADIMTILRAEDEAIMTRLLNGEQVTKEGGLSWFPSFTGRLDSPDDPLPPVAECLHINTRISAPFLKRLRQQARTKRLPMTEKLPIITSTEDAALGLRDVLRPDGILRIIGGNLFLDRDVGVSQCLLEGTRSGGMIQTRIGTASNSEIILLPDVPGQDDPWNNEYRLSLTTRYTAHGTRRTGIYKRMLRTPLTVMLTDNGPPLNIGILTNNAAAPYVSITGGTVGADETLRIRVIQDLPGHQLLFSLTDMREGGVGGDEISVTADGEYTLPGFAGSAVSSLNITVNEYAALWKTVRSSYSGMMADILNVKTA